MNEEMKKEIPPAGESNSFLADVERLFLEGRPTREIATILGEDGYRVGRNLREIKRR